MDKKKILLIEDDPFLTEMTKHVLEKRQYILETARNSDDLFLRLATFKPNLLILDNLLERGPTGIELCQKIKADPAFASLPILLTTGQTNYDEAQNSTIKPEGILLKPFDVDDLVKKVSELVG
jgi:two-component system, OmpR family, phosphate regulon response regulator PhoB